ncbi:PHA/PHB synthase family protein [Mongoliimonas terrestris]|uniref:PHA/PHB synthase family protein n=1 Tax=Mongoliimonas terrestris TaxID=1709001 RepID=UPI000949A222|nr:alpha/beta fold hydrolase [Mongoliimonas terrestris]
MLDTSLPPPSSADTVRCRTEADALGYAGFDAIDRMMAATTGGLTGGLSPMGLSLATLDWAGHLAGSPGKRAELVVKAWTKALRFAVHAAQATADPRTPPCIEPLPGDDRFTGEAWSTYPFNLWAQGFLLTQQWWHNATREVPGVSPHHEDVVSFAARQLLDILSPSNMPLTNPEVLAEIAATGGANLLEGARNLADDVGRALNHAPPPGADAFRAGETVALTPGTVVARNPLMELIQYAPATDVVAAEPVLIVPAWIMKYYILDLSPANSLIGHLVARGHTVFCISWRNVTAEHRDYGMEAYRRLGVGAALDAIGAILPGRKVHAAGYCLGGTLLTVAAAAMARRGDDRLASVSLLAAQTDFTEPGELALFIDHSEVRFLDSMMWQRGYLDAGQMAGAFQLLRARDLIWSRLVRAYLMGEREPMTDLMAWNADATRLPYRMHAEYLTQFFLRNDLASGRYEADGYPVSVQNIRVPIFAVGTERDHVAPWRSVFKIHNLADTDVTFVLTSGGHNAGIVSEPGHPRRHYRIRHHPADAPLVGPDEWLAGTRPVDGSWWLAWGDWLDARSAASRVQPPPMGAPAAGYPPLAPAPGTYVFER